MITYVTSVMGYLWSMFVPKTRMDTQIQHMFPHERSKKRYRALTSVSTQTYSKRYCNKTHKGDQVSHIIAKKNKGANALVNYYMSPSKFNQSIQDNYDHLNAALVGVDRSRRAVNVSKENGYDGLSGSILHRKGVEEFSKIGVKVRREGGIDKRCSAVKSGDLIIRKDGGIDGRSVFIKRKAWK